MIQVKVSDDDASESLIEVRADEREVRVAAVIEMAHMHTTIEHDSLPIDCHNHTALPHLLPSAQNERVDGHLIDSWRSFEFLAFQLLIHWFSLYQPDFFTTNELNGHRLSRSG